MAYSVTLIRGDGIGLEVAKATQTVIDKSMKWGKKQIL